MSLYHFKSKATLFISSAWWPLNRGDKDSTLVGMAKRCPRPREGGARLIEVSFTILFYCCPFNRGRTPNRWPFKGGSIVVRSMCYAECIMTIELVR